LLRTVITSIEMSLSVGTFSVTMKLSAYSLSAVAPYPSGTPEATPYPDAHALVFVRAMDGHNFQISWESPTTSGPLYRYDTLVRAGGPVLETLRYDRLTNLAVSFLMRNMTLSPGVTPALFKLTNDEETETICDVSLCVGIKACTGPMTCGFLQAVSHGAGAAPPGRIPSAFLRTIILWSRLRSGTAGSGISGRSPAVSGTSGTKRPAPTWTS
jgi:hypothetical protein